MKILFVSAVAGAGRASIIADAAVSPTGQTDRGWRQDTERDGYHCGRAVNGCDVGNCSKN